MLACMYSTYFYATVPRLLATFELELSEYICDVLLRRYIILLEYKQLYLNYLLILIFFIVKTILSTGIHDKELLKCFHCDKYICCCLS